MNVAIVESAKAEIEKQLMRAAGAGFVISHVHTKILRHMSGGECDMITMIDLSFVGECHAQTSTTTDQSAPA